MHANYTQTSRTQQLNKANGGTAYEEVFVHTYDGKTYFPTAPIYPAVPCSTAMTNMRVCMSAKTFPLHRKDTEGTPLESLRHRSYYVQAFQNALLAFFITVS